LNPLSNGDLLDLYPKHSPARLAELIQTFIIEEKYTPKDPPPYVAAIFSPLGRNIVSMISCVLGYSTSEYIDEIILAFMSIYILGQPPATIYDFAKFIADRMHEQFLRMSIKRIFKYSSVLYHLFLYFQAGKFPTYLAKIGHQWPTKISHLWCWVWSLIIFYSTATLDPSSKWGWQCRP